MFSLREISMSIWSKGALKPSTAVAFALDIASTICVGDGDAVVNLDSVDDVKKKIENDLGSGVYHMAQQVLIIQEKILIDGTTVDENKVKNNDFIVLMLSMVQKEPHTGLQPSFNATQASFAPSQGLRMIQLSSQWLKDHH